jgi:hypothetical protein
MNRNMLLLLLESKFPDFSPVNDKIIYMADNLLESKITGSSQIMRYPYDDFIELSRDEVARIFDQENSEKYEAFTDEFNLINKEIVNVSATLKECYLNKVVEISGMKISDMSARDILYFIEKHCIKVKRLNFVAQPDYSLSTAYSKKSKKKYEAIKAFWIDAEGNKVRSFSKNVGIAGLEVEESVVKLFESLGYITTQLQNPLNNGFKADLIVEKDNKKWVIEIKMKDKKRFFDTYARLELWKLYKSLYWS